MSARDIVFFSLCLLVANYAIALIFFRGIIVRKEDPKITKFVFWMSCIPGGALVLLVLVIIAYGYDAIMLFRKAYKKIE